MSALLNWLGIGKSAPSAANFDDPRWWDGSARLPTEAGVRITADVALTLSTFWACVRFISETVGSLPLMVYERRPDGGRRRAINNPLYDVLHNRPNGWQTPAEFKALMQVCVLLWGNGYARIVPGERGAVDALEPIHPERVTVERLGNGRLRYQVKNEGGMGSRAYTQDEMFHLRGMSGDGVTGMSVVAYARNSVGLSMAAERYGSRFFANDSRPGGVLTTDKRLSEGVPDRMKQRWRETQAGTHRGDIAILEEGLSFAAVGVPPEDAQFLGTRDHQALDVCRWFGVAPHMVGVPGGVTEWGSGLEQLGQGVVTYTLMPWLVRWQEAIARDLIIAPRVFYAEFLTESLLRGDIQARYAAYATARQWGWVSVNEIRQWENLNPVENGDVYLEPLNMQEAGQTAEAVTTSGAAEAVMGGHYEALARAAAGRLVRKEMAALGKAKERAGDDWGVWGAAVGDFYHGHAGLVAETMQVDRFTAAAYCQRRIHEWVDGVGEENEARAIDALVMLAMEDGA